MKKNLLFISVLIFILSCGKKKSVLPTHSIDEIIGTYSGIDSNYFVDVKRHINHTTDTIMQWGIKKNRIIMVTKLSDTSFRIDLDSTTAPNKFTYTGNTYYTSLPRSRKITFYPDKDSISITDDFLLSNSSPSDDGDGVNYDGEYVREYDAFNGRR